MALRHCHNVADFRLLAKKKLPAPIFHYMDGAADDELTLKRSTAAFDDYELIPNYLVDVEKIDMTTEILGQKIEWPVFLSPTGMSRLFHYKGEPVVARAAARAGTLYSLSTLATTSIEDVAASSDGPKMFQIYVLKDRGLNKEFIERCRAANFAALCLTVDVPVAGNRERDYYTGMTLPPRFTLGSMLSFAAHPAWTFHQLFSKKIDLANVSHRFAGGSGGTTSVIEYMNSQFDRTVTWDDAAKIIDMWGGPFAIKGILSVQDAKRAAEIGATAIMVSAHGGRQMDSVPAPIDQIGRIADAVGDRIEIILDGGVRRGSHVLKALAMGARACSIGRAYLFGLAAGGEAGVDRALALLRAEVERGMILLGCKQIDQIDGSLIRAR